MRLLNATFLLCGLMVASSALAYTPDAAQKSEILRAMTQSLKVTPQILKDIEALTGKSPDSTGVINEFDCLNTGSTDSDYRFYCDVGYTITSSGGRKQN